MKERTRIHKKYISVECSKNWQKMFYIKWNCDNDDDDDDDSGTHTNPSHSVRFCFRLFFYFYALFNAVIHSQ